MTEIRIATAGWNVPTDLAAQLGVSGSHLERHGALLNAAEINSTFYRAHRGSTFERWADSVPGDFRFAVKLARTLTHEAHLADPAGIDEALEGPQLLGEKLGPLLVQLPPSLRLDVPVAERFFAQLASCTHQQVVLEARHRSWFGPQADELLDRHHLVRVIADPPRGGAGPALDELAALGPDRFAYVRLHGSPEIYKSAYDSQSIATLARLIKDRTAPTWCVLDNTASGAALPNALDLQQLVSIPVSTRA